MTVDLWGPMRVTKDFPCIHWASPALCPLPYPSSSITQILQLSWLAEIIQLSKCDLDDSAYCHRCSWLGVLVLEIGYLSYHSLTVFSKLTLHSHAGRRHKESWFWAGSVQTPAITTENQDGLCIPQDNGSLEHADALTISRRQCSADRSQEPGTLQLCVPCGRRRDYGYSKGQFLSYWMVITKSTSWVCCFTVCCLFLCFVVLRNSLAV